MNEQLFKKRFVVIAIVIAISVVSIISCTKDPAYDPPAPVAQQPDPRIDAFAPVGAGKDSIVVITGVNFIPGPGGNLVTINRVNATVISATATRIEVKVPAGAGSGMITVKAGVKSAHSATDFKYLYTASTLAGDGSRGFKDGAGNIAQF